MEIIKRGTLPEETKYCLTCERCKTEFRFKQSEGHYQSDQRDGSFVSIACPVCKQTCYAYPGKTSPMSSMERTKAYYEK